MSARRIDVHTHALSADVAVALTGRGFEPTGGYKISVQWSPGAALAYMDRHEIAAQLVSMPMAFAGSRRRPAVRNPAVPDDQRRQRRTDRQVSGPVRGVRQPTRPTAPSRRWPNWPTP